MSANAARTLQTRDSDGGRADEIENDISLEALARRQGVSPVTDLDALSALWPAEDDADALESFILEGRTARRRLAQAGAEV